MKISWATGIVLAFLGFIAFILYFVIRMSTDDNVNHDLVTPEYYKKELEYQEDLDAFSRSEDLNARLQIEVNKNGVLIRFPEDLMHKKLSGTVHFYRPSNRNLDFKIPIEIKKPELVVPHKNLVKGRWDITVRWTYKGTHFLSKQKLTY